MGTDGKPLDLELEIEIERLKIWSKTVGLNADPVDVLGSIWFAGNYSFNDYSNLQLLLINIQIEFGVIAAELQKTSHGHPAFRLYYHLQQLQDQLWDGQPLAVRRIMFSRLEEAILSKAHPGQVKKASELAKGTLTDGPGNYSYSLSTEQFYKRFACLATMRNVASAILR